MRSLPVCCKRLFSSCRKRSWFVGFEFLFLRFEEKKGLLGLEITLFHRLGRLKEPSA
jgi:hypothetical protein